MEDLNVVNDTQTPVVAASESEAEQSGMEDMQSADVAPRAQSMADNSKFRKLRLENERLKSENERLQAEEIERLMQEDLAQIRKLAPEVESLEALGDDFADLIAAGVRAPVAFAAISQLKKANTPPETGAVGGSDKGEKEYYSPEEVDALSEAELDNERIWQRVRKSMTKW